MICTDAPPQRFNVRSAAAKGKTVDDKDVQRKIIEFLNEHPKTDLHEFVNASNLKSVKASSLMKNLLQMLDQGRVEYSVDRKLVVFKA